MQAEFEAFETEEGKRFDPNSVSGTLIVAFVLCLVCSLVVSTAAVKLRPLQEANQERKMKRNVLIAAGIWDKQGHTDADIPELFEPIETVLVNLPVYDVAEPSGADTPTPGTLNTELDPATYNQRKASKDPEQSVTIPSEEDVAKIKRRERVSAAYLVTGDDGTIRTIVLPIYGKGLWSTLYGYLAVAADTRTVAGITFYEHKETPGLGGEVDNPKWKARWQDLMALDEDGQPVLVVTKPGSAADANEVDGLSGATITSNGVENAVQYWLGPGAFGPFLDRIRSGQLAVRSDDRE